MIKTGDLVSFRVADLNQIKLALYRNALDAFKLIPEGALPQKVRNSRKIGALLSDLSNSINWSCFDSAIPVIPDRDLMGNEYFPWFYGFFDVGWCPTNYRWEIDRYFRKQYWDYESAGIQATGVGQYFSPKTIFPAEYDKLTKPQIVVETIELDACLRLEFFHHYCPQRHIPKWVSGSARRHINECTRVNSKQLIKILSTGLMPSGWYYSEMFTKISG